MKQSARHLGVGARRAERMRVLIVAAHPDDEVLGCGGTIARLAGEQDIRVVILGEGITSRTHLRSSAARVGLRRLRDEALAAGAVLGAQSVEFGGLPDNRFDERPLLRIVQQVERCIERYQPTAVYTHHPGDLNIDHRMTFQAVLTATRPVSHCPVRELYAFEVPSATEWAFQRLEPVFKPNVFIDISDTIEAKVQAMRRYAGELRPFPHPRSPEALRAIAQRWGSVAGMPYAEAFELIRWMR